MKSLFISCIFIVCFIFQVRTSFNKKNFDLQGDSKVMIQEYQDFKDEMSMKFRLRIWRYHLLKESNPLIINRRFYNDTLEMILISR